MKAENLSTLEKIIKRRSTALGFYPEGLPSGVVHIAAPRECAHLKIELSNPFAPPLSLQISIRDERDILRALLFPSPRILTEQTVNPSLYLANEANRELYRGAAAGRFWVDMESLDFAYELILKESTLKSNAEEVAAQLFDIPLAHFHDLHIPLVMLAGGTWDHDTALRYFQQLRTDGQVDNRDYL